MPLGRTYSLARTHFYLKWPTVVYYHNQLSKYWDVNYEREGKKAKFCLGIRELLENDEAASQEDAIKQAKKLMELHAGELPHGQNPVTTVFELVAAREYPSSPEGYQYTGL
jgi:hypothetical protein